MSNSLAADLTMWDGQAETLAQTFRVIRYDTRGHGRTEATRGDYSLDLLVDDVLALLDTLDIDQVHFVGLSLGGMIGQSLSARAPQRVKSLTLCATFAQTSYELWDQRIAAVRASGLAPIVDATVERWLTAPFRATHDSVVKAARAMIGKTSIDGYAGCAAAIRDMDLAHAAEKITAPTLLIAGAEDPSATPDMMRDLHRRIRGAEFTMLPDAAHVFTLEKPQAVTEIIGKFLAKHD
jgi:3-oxoadipate enol-lactonase